MARISLEKTARYMVDVLVGYANEKDVDLHGVTRDNFNSELDRRFADGGFARCEHFADFGWRYSRQFGELDSDGFNDAQARVLEEALILLEQEYPAR